MELSGTVDAIGKNVRGYNIGQAIFGITGLSLVSNVEYVSLPQSTAILPKSVNLSHSETASLIEGGLTALNFLKNQARI